MPCGACFLLLSFPGSFPHALLAACLLGASLGADADLCSYLVARYFGLRHFGALYGALISVLGLSVGVGPPVAGLVYEQTGSYDAYFLAGIPICLLASLMIWLLGPYRDEKWMSGS
jgi:MFS family permease